MAAGSPMKPILPAIAFLLLSAIAVAPSASAATATWSDDDACGLSASVVTLTFCTIQGGMMLQSETSGTACVKSGSTFVRCSPYLFCYAYFHSDVPFHYESDCAGAGGESCDGIRQAGNSGCPGGSGPWAAYMADVWAGSCATYTLTVDLSPQVPAIPPAHLAHSITLCVDGVTGPSMS